MDAENITSAAEADDFFSEFDVGEDVTAAEPAAEAEPEENTTQTDSEQEATEGAESEEKSEGEIEQENTESGKADAPAAEQDNPEQMFDIITDGKAEKVSLAELKTRAQKGGAFDRVKGQLDQARQTIKEMTEAGEKTSKIMELLEFAAEKTGVPIDDLPKSFYTAFIKSQGGTQAQADAELKAFVLEKQLNAKNAAETNANTKSAEADNTARAEADLNEFRNLFPDVKLEAALTDDVKADIQKGMSLANAYQKYLNKEMAAKLEQEKKQIAADEKNRKNRMNSPGGQKSGGGSSNNADADFFANFIV